MKFGLGRWSASDLGGWVRMSARKDVDETPVNRDRVWLKVIGIVLLSVTLNAGNAISNLSSLTMAHHVIGIGLWLVLPGFALFLMGRGQAMGRWILVGLFGLRAIASLLLLLGHGHLLVQDLALCFRWPFRTYIVEVMFYGGASVWLLSSKRVRKAMCQTTPTSPELHQNP